MGSVYRNAVVTIAASSAAGDADGFLHPRAELFQGTVTLQPEDPESRPRPVRYRQVMGHTTDLKEPLQMRAWAFRKQHQYLISLLFWKV